MEAKAEGRRVGMIAHSYYKEDTRVRREAESLVAVGYAVDVVCLSRDGEPEEEIFKGVRIIRQPIGRSQQRTKLAFIVEYLRFAWLAFLYMSFAGRRRRYFVVVVHNMPNFLVFAALVQRLQGARIILDMHDAMPELYGTLFGARARWLRWALHVEERLSTAFAHQLITANRSIAELLEKRNRRHFFVLHNTPDLGLLAPPKSVITRDDARFRLLHHGNIHERYGLDRAVRAMFELKRSGECDYLLEVHGQGPFYSRIKELVQELGIESVVVLRGAFKPEDLLSILQRADVGLVLNRPDPLTHLLLPVKLLEYVAFNVPVICPRMAAIEHYFNEHDLYYFEHDHELQDLIRHVRANPAEARMKSQSAYEKYQTIAWPRESERYNQLVGSI